MPCHNMADVAPATPQVTFLYHMYRNQGGYWECVWTTETQPRNESIVVLFIEIQGMNGILFCGRPFYFHLASNKNFPCPLGGFWFIEDTTFCRFFEDLGGGILPWSENEGEFPAYDQEEEEEEEASMALHGPR